MSGLWTRYDVEDSRSLIMQMELPAWSKQPWVNFLCMTREFNVPLFSELKIA